MADTSENQTSQPATADGAAPGDGGASASATPEIDLGFLPDRFRGEDGPDFGGFRQAYDGLAGQVAEFSALHDGAPETPDEYSFALPEQLDLSDIPGAERVDIENIFDPKAPEFAQLAEILHGIKAPQALATKLAGLLAKSQIAAEANWISASEAAIAKELGPNAQTRIDALQARIGQRLSKENAAALSTAFTDPAMIKALEALTASGDTTPTPTPNTPDISKMTPREMMMTFAKGLD